MTTICAISTPAGSGGIAVIRISGKNAFEICDRIFIAKNGKKIVDAKANTIIFGQIEGQPQGSPIQVIDEVIVSIFRTPHSFTGEDTVEISAHGSLFVQQAVLKLLLENGATLAQAGEFTQRAFMNGKMDLSQAEAVADLIASQNAASHKIAMNQMRGGFSSELQKLRLQLLDFVSLIELELDFSEENVEFADRENLKNLAKNISEKINKLIASFSVGNAIKNGVPVVIAGETNVGKSTLLNFLLNEEKAIVSDIHGTTRDIIEDCVDIQGVAFRFIDTAGIRQTKNEIEKIGIERAFQQIEKAQIVLCLLDCTKNIDELQPDISFCHYGLDTQSQKTILVFNKIDLISRDKIDFIKELYHRFDCPKVFISVKEKINTENLIDLLIQKSQVFKIQANDVIISNIRHYEALKNTQTAILRIIDGLQNHISNEFLSQDIRECLHFLGEITGEITTDEILGNIFSRFCIGK
ncbi:MAG: tRNA uridine-5-carboxymethylaminomethyl(34) synthesis GTPase MnmE [Prevotellaceae bacterium]|jgi:tRNA modification GTPase|nr:tRNA uridine-5-carboxymethylaminomethyl(34) synthesis GTPase MnmE [Prevotellaceae bacterium]